MLVEITERQSFSLTEQLSEKFALLRKAGLHVAIDDFGGAPGRRVNVLHHSLC